MSQKKTVLEMIAAAREGLDGTPVVPWWRDSKKVIKRALFLANDDDAEAQKYFLNELTKMAEGDERFRRCLLTRIAEPGKGRRGNTRRPLWWPEFILKNLEVAEKMGKPKTYGVRLSAMHLNKSEKTIWSILKELKELKS